MRLLSSRATFFYKRVFPTIWFGILAIFLVASLFSGARSNLPLPLVIMPLVMMALGYFIMKRTVFDLADRVWDAGDALLIRKGSDEARVPLSEIVNVSYSEFSSPARVTLSLRTPSVFGDRVAFSAPMRIVPFSKNPAIDDLIKRIDSARRRR